MKISFKTAVPPLDIFISCSNLDTFYTFCRDVPTKTLLFTFHPVTSCHPNVHFAPLPSPYRTEFMMDVQVDDDPIYVLENGARQEMIRFVSGSDPIFPRLQPQPSVTLKRR